MTTCQTNPEEKLVLYEIRLKGHLDDHWAAWFGGLTITRESNGETCLTGTVIDQAALHGLLKKVRDLGLPWISVIRIDPKSTNRPRSIDGRDEQPNTKSQNVIRENQMNITASNLIRWSGLSAAVAGIIFAGIQPIHPLDVLASVNTVAWGIITPFKTVMCLLFMLGFTGLYARQVKETGWIGLVGYLLFSLCWALQLVFIFTEAFIIPPLATAAPHFVDGFFGIFNGQPSEINLGFLPALWTLIGGLYVFGGLLLGIATFRAGILPRWASGLLAVAATFTPIAGLLSHPLNRIVAVPMGIALAWLGFALFFERRQKVLESLHGTGSPPLIKSEPSKVA